MKVMKIVHFGNEFQYLHTHTRSMRFTIKKMVRAKRTTNDITKSIKKNVHFLRFALILVKTRLGFCLALISSFKQNEMTFRCNA